MKSSEDYIAMRANAHRASWLTLAIFLLVGIIGFVVLASNYDYFGTETLIGLLREYADVLVLALVVFATSLYKAYHKVPFETNSSGTFTMDGDAGGD